MIRIELNGQPRELSAPLTLQDLIETCRLPKRAIAVAINSEVIPRSEFQKIRIRDRDRVEVIQPVGGG